jgi:hypothetical protein
MVAKESTRHQEKINGGTHLDDTAFPSCPSYYSVAVDARNDTDTTGLYRICALLSKRRIGTGRAAGIGHWARICVIREVVRGLFSTVRTLHRTLRQ